MSADDAPELLFIPAIARPALAERTARLVWQVAAVLEACAAPAPALDRGVLAGYQEGRSDVAGAHATRRPDR